MTQCGWFELPPIGGEGGAERCTSGKPATFRNCGFRDDIRVCEDHKCRCPQPATPPASPVERPVTEDLDDLTEAESIELSVTSPNLLALINNAFSQLDSRHDEVCKRAREELAGLIRIKREDERR